MRENIIENLTSKMISFPALMQIKLYQIVRKRINGKYFDEFSSLIEHPKSLVRNRALYILAANARCAHVIIRPEFENPVIARV